MIYLKTAVVSLCLTLASAGVPNKDRVFESKLSDEEPGSKDYDHEAFMGEEGAKQFEKLSEEESKRRLGIIFDKIDADGDGQLTEAELQDWITKTQKRYVDENTQKEFENMDTDRDGSLTWNEYYGLNFGFLKEEDWEQDEDQYSYKKMLERDQARWNAADENSDNSCDFEEYKAFLHPEEYERMKDVVLDETVKDMDKNGDGFLDIEEYMTDLYRPDDNNEEEPEWVGVEREQFQKYRDANKDGRLDREEVRNWILPEDYNHAQAEAAHLVHASDNDQDDKISKEEMLEHHDIFVGSQATEWGEMINRHDEF